MQHRRKLVEVAAFLQVAVDILHDFYGGQICRYILQCRPLAEIVALANVVVEAVAHETRGLPTKLCMVRGVPVPRTAELYLQFVRGIETRIAHQRRSKIQVFGDLRHFQPRLMKMFEYVRGGLTSGAAEA